MKIVPETEHDVLSVLKTELAFLELGGYSMGESWGARWFFEDSPTCINYDRRENPLPCRQCPLINFVPPELRDKPVPCRLIPLNEAGDTLARLYEAGARPEEIEEILAGWLRATIRRLEEERRQREAAQGPAPPER